MKTTHSSGPALLSALIVVAAALSSGADAVESEGRRESNFAGKTFVVTGASDGFGRGVAVELGRRHANVVLAARRSDWLREVAREVRAAGGTSLAVTADATSPADMARLRRAAVGRFGKIDAWINTAGVTVIPNWQAPPDNYAQFIVINMNGVRNGSREAIRQFRSQRYGTLVNVGSIDSKVPLTYQTAYPTIKAGVLGFGRSLNREMHQDGLGRTVKVATVMPEDEDPPRRDRVEHRRKGPPRMEAMYVSQRDVDAIVGATIRPREEIPVFWKSGATYAFRNLTPDFVQVLSDEIEDRKQAERSFSPR